LTIKEEISRLQNSSTGSFLQNIKRVNIWLRSKQKIEEQQEEAILDVLCLIRDTLIRIKNHVFIVKKDQRELNRLVEEANTLYVFYQKLKNLVRLDYNDAEAFYKDVEDSLIEGKIKYENQLEKFGRFDLDKASHEILENEYPKIFKCSKSYCLFLKMNHIYSKEKNHLAYYSFLFYAMDQDKYLVCSGTDFVKFLNSEFDIDIEKIDYRQYKAKNKESLYNAIKENLNEV